MIPLLPAADKLDDYKRRRLEFDFRLDCQFLKPPRSWKFAEFYDTFVVS